MRQPEVYLASTLKNWDTDRCVHDIKTSKDAWIPARPVGHNIYPLTWRWRLAWFVLIGKYDAVFWGD